MEQKKVKIALLQMSSELGDIEANIEKIRTIITSDLPKDTDVLVLPEVWSVGWSCPDFKISAQKTNDGSISRFLSEIAQKYNVNIIGGSIITEKDESYYNTCLVYNRKGELVSSYSKMHLYSYYGYEEDKYVNCGENPVIVELDGVKFGLSICYDIRFPELYRAYAKAGADVFVNCAAWGSNKPIPWEVMTKSRAVENQTYMLALTQCGKIKNDEYNLGISRIIDYKGEEISIIKLREGIIYAELNLNKMYEFRAKSPTIKDIKNNYEVKILCEKY